MTHSLPEGTQSAFYYGNRRGRKSTVRKKLRGAKVGGVPEKRTGEFHGDGIYSLRSRLKTGKGH